MAITVEEFDRLVAEMFVQDKVIAGIEVALSAENKLLQGMEQKVVEALKELGRDSYKTPQGTVSIQQKWRWNLPKTEEDRAAFFGYLKEKHLFDKMISVNSNSLNSYIKQEWETAKEENRLLDFSVPGISEPTLFETLSTRKAK